MINDSEKEKPEENEEITDHLTECGIIWYDDPNYDEILSTDIVDTHDPNYLG